MNDPKNKPAVLAPQVRRAHCADADTARANDHVELPVPDPYQRCGGIDFGGQLVKSLVFSTDVALIRNCNADAVLAVYPFACQADINQALIQFSDRPVLCGVAGNITQGNRALELARRCEAQGALGVVANMMTSAQDIELLSSSLSIPVVLTVAVLNDATRERISAGAALLNVAAGSQTYRLVGLLRAEYPQLPIMASGGHQYESFLRTIEAGADALSWTPPSVQDIERQVMLGHRIRANA